MSASIDWHRSFARCSLELQTFELGRRGELMARFVYREHMLLIDAAGGNALPTVFCCCQKNSPVHHVTSLEPLPAATDARERWLTTLRRRLDGTEIKCPPP